MFSIFTYIMSRVTHSEPGLPMYTQAVPYTTYFELGEPVFELANLLRCISCHLYATFLNFYRVHEVQYAFSDALSCGKYSMFSTVNKAIMNTFIDSLVP